MTRTLYNLTMLIGLLAGTPAFADSLSSERVRALVKAGEILPLEEILTRNQTNTQGRIVEIELERKRGVYVYEIKVLRSDGRYAKLKIDARSGSPIRGDE
jgi:uncharacterized membrane protein YkoI